MSLNINEFAQVESKKKEGGSGPPQWGICKECKKYKKINRLKLCYLCFVELEIIARERGEGRDWKRGDPHPDWCGCSGLGAQHKNGDGSERGSN